MLGLKLNHISKRRCLSSHGYIKWIMHTLFLHESPYTTEIYRFITLVPPPPPPSITLDWRTASISSVSFKVYSINHASDYVCYDYIINSLWLHGVNNHIIENSLRRPLDWLCRMNESFSSISTSRKYTQCKYAFPSETIEYIVQLTIFVVSDPWLRIKLSLDLWQLPSSPPMQLPVPTRLTFQPYLIVDRGSVTHFDPDDTPISKQRFQLLKPLLYWFTSCWD